MVPVAEEVCDALGERLAELRHGRPTSPKRPPKGATTEAWYSYYAGYADAFVEHILQALPADLGLILDPWNGAGATTSVASKNGLRSIGLDINPAAVVVAKARLLRSDVSSSVEPLTHELLAAATRNPIEISEDEPLLSWFTPPAARGLRSIERHIYRLLVSSDDDGDLTAARALHHVSSFATLFYLGFFRVVRRLVERFIGTNPTWIRHRIAASERIDLPRHSIASSYRGTMRVLSRAVKHAERAYTGPNPGTVGLSDSTALPLESNAVGAVLTSPPYCTRIDYVIATLPELAALGVSRTGVRALRDRMIGTPTIAGGDLSFHSSWGHRAKSLLDITTTHESHGARTYYTPFYRQYFAGMWDSLVELDRVVGDGGPIIIVAQDSFFKQHRVAVPEIIAEMANSLGWTLVAKHDFAVPANRAAMHPAARSYRRTSAATESVLVLRG